MNRFVAREEDGRWEIEDPRGEMGAEEHGDCCDLSICKLPSTICDFMTFEDLESWKKARAAVREIYTMTHGKEICRDFGLCGNFNPQPFP